MTPLTSEKNKLHLNKTKGHIFQEEHGNDNDINQC